uniref:Ty3 transposon capsid-like protein domain-containing protein n=1 Tax=Clastoptera arizonana TaxID=38151 RepID=A0A1B6DSS3_9HEMI
MITKARFHFASQAGKDHKSTLIKVKTIQLVDQPEIFLFPEEKQTNVHHVELFNNIVVKGVVKSLKLRNKFRNVIITLDEELKSIYLDEEGNVTLHDEYLEETPPTQINNVNTKSARSLVKDIVLEKFNGSNFNANSWLKLFIKECIRVDIPENKYAEILRLFLENSALDWFSIYAKDNDLEKWDLWNNSFLETFAVQSWAELAYAYNFKYFNGSFLEFALKKRNLLLEADETMSINTQINLIIINLPKFIQSKLEKKNIINMEDLMSKLKQFGHLNEKNKFTPILKLCSFCTNLGYTNRFHKEDVCRLKDGKFKKVKNEQIKIVNNAELQNIIANSEESKNV